MSRYDLDVERVATGEIVSKLSYGFDHAVGYFLQIFDLDGECVVDWDALTGFTGKDLATFLSAARNNGGEIPMRHILCARNGVRF